LRDYGTRLFRLYSHILLI